MIKQWLSIFLLSFSYLQAESPSPSAALERLISGNLRFVENHSTHPDETGERRKELANIQEPFAIILGCSDSRVSPEIIFDQGIGDIFVVRVAGNVIGPVVLDSIDYSAIHLHSSIIMVLGHQNCGAVSAVLQGKGDEIEAIAAQIAPSVAKTKMDKGDPLENAIKQNVKEMVAQLRATPCLAKLIKSGKIGIVGGYYDFCTGTVEVLTR